ncbi:hypothetical protein CC80DRAFT_72686 [Byssothecium circinans]|uniref:Uncharacterized protein n=1 Tax=Byssothecium circinans TaxID=147558 RepID=A0A6A5TZW2_9PLEO|nr:hypothetical protein CC80DRAFT_72686 [Byssothecium circinans]
MPGQRDDETKRRPTSTKKAPTRKFFNSVEPTFSIAQPKTQQLQFLDNSDPGKNAVVRKKAREWVHRNKQQELAVKTKRAVAKKKYDGEVEFELRQERMPQLDVLCDPLMNVAAGRPDPFETFPKVGRNVDHIIEYFLTSCPEQIPCSDDKYAWRPRQPSLEVAKNNSVFSNMAESYVSFVLWLYATTMMRDAITKECLSEETLYFYTLSLRTLQKIVNDNSQVESDAFIRALSCFTACAAFCGMFEAAEMHCNAMLKAVALKGKGNLIAGFRQYKPFTQKVMMWCEFGVTVYNRTLPKLPYTPPPISEPLAVPLLLEADRLTVVTLSSIPPVSDRFKTVFRLLHQLSLSQATSPTTPNLFPRDKKKDRAVLRPMYDMQWILLQLSAAQQIAGHEYSKVDVMLTEACHLAFYMGPRALAPQMALCDSFVTGLKKALLSLIEDAESPQAASSTGDAPPILRTEPNIPPVLSLEKNDSTIHTISTSRTLDNVVLWVLYIGTIASSANSRPEYGWYQERFRAQVQAMGVKDRDDLKQVLRLFPNTEGSPYISMDKVDHLLSGSDT